MEDSYAQAVLNASRQPGASDAQVVENLVAHLKREGRMKLLPAILRALTRLQARHAQAVVEVASESDAAEALAQAAAHGIADATVSVNPSLIRGWRARSASMLVDRSGKRALIDLYRSIAGAS